MDICPPIHVSTTFKHETDSSLHSHVYSRISTQTRDQCEVALGKLEDCFAVTYSSGMSAICSCLQYFMPRRIFINQQGYHGTRHAINEIYAINRQVEIVYIKDSIQFQDLIIGDLIWLESPQNPRGEIHDIASIKSQLPHGVILAIDSTLSPPPIQFALKYGADVVMHSSTKYLGGHSDLLGGVLMTKSKSVATKLMHQRSLQGNVMGNLESWLLLRSLKTLQLRVMKQSDTAMRLASWLYSKSDSCLTIVKKVWHASLKSNPGHEVAKKQGNGWSGVLSIEFYTIQQAKNIPNFLKAFSNATSLGGVESLIEWRYSSDKSVSPTLCRLSIGLEDFQELKSDLIQAFDMAQNTKNRL